MYLEKLRLDGRVAVVTGAGQGHRKQAAPEPGAKNGTGGWFCRHRVPSIFTDKTGTPGWCL